MKERNNLNEKYITRLSKNAKWAETISWQLTGVVKDYIWAGGRGTPENSWWECAARFSKFHTQNFIFHSRF